MLVCRCRQFWPGVSRHYRSPTGARCDAITCLHGGSRHSTYCSVTILCNASCHLESTRHFTVSSFYVTLPVIWNLSVFVCVMINLRKVYLLVVWCMTSCPAYCISTHISDRSAALYISYPGTNMWLSIRLRDMKLV